MRIALTLCSVVLAACMPETKALHPIVSLEDAKKGIGTASCIASTQPRSIPVAQGEEMVAFPVLLCDEEQNELGYLIYWSQGYGDTFINEIADMHGVPLNMHKETFDEKNQYNVFVPEIDLRGSNYRCVVLKPFDGLPPLAYSRCRAV